MPLSCYCFHKKYSALLFHITLISLLTSSSPNVVKNVSATSVTSSPPSTNGIPLSGNSYYDIPNLNKESYVIPGDISIGATVEATEKPEKESRKLCTSDINSSGSWLLQYIEALAYAVKLVNSDPSLLPNVTLGLVVLDDCGIPSGALAQALSFVPRSTHASNSYSHHDQGCSSNESVSSSMSLGVDSPQNITHYDVVGVLGPLGSELSLPISYLYTAVKLPLLSYMATSDDLSDNFHHRYFLRVVPPDKFQARAMLRFIQDHGWSYVSVLYQEGSYGESGYDNIREMAPSFNICIATAHRMRGLRSDYAFLVKQLLKFPRARVVILFTVDSEVKLVFAEVKRQNVVGHFIWMGSDGIADRTMAFRDFMDVALGTIIFNYYSRPVGDFFRYFGNLTVNSTTNPWFKPFWEVEHKCSFDAGTCDATKSIDAEGTMRYSQGTSLAIDAVFTFARALDRLLRDVCPNAHGKKARNCIQREDLLRYLLTTSFSGYTDTISFDDRGDAVGKYQIKQLVLDIPDSNYSTRFDNDSMVYREMVEVSIGLYGTTEGNISYDGTNHLLWEHLHDVEPLLPAGSSLLNVPESVCSRPCGVGEYKIGKEVPCCWDCRRCRDNERLVGQNTRCEACPTFTWPDPSTGYSTCIPIPPIYPAMTDTLPLIQICFASFAIVVTVLVTVTYVMFRNERVIKAASRELSFLQLIAIVAGYCSSLLCQPKPTPGTCGALYFLFCLSFTWLYAPLLVKTIRIYRIFHSGSKSNQPPKFVSPRSQLAMSGGLIVNQVLICIIVMAVYKPTARRYQPVWSEKYVELSCDLSGPGVISFLSYNLVLVSLCSIFAFKTRKLPDNFNESRFISMCVTTTLIIWLAFVATFFTADRAHVRILILSVCLLLNHTVALLFLYLPKIYAVTCLPNEVIPAATVTGAFHTANSAVP